MFEPLCTNYANEPRPRFVPRIPLQYIFDTPQYPRNSILQRLKVESPPDVISISMAAARTEWEF